MENLYFKQNNYFKSHKYFISTLDLFRKKKNFSYLFSYFDKIKIV